eukprot:6195097-Pleurochrysis_carterae.AAC.3
MSHAHLLPTHALHAYASHGHVLHAHATDAHALHIRSHGKPTPHARTRRNRARRMIRHRVQHALEYIRHAACVS